MNSFETIQQALSYTFGDKHVSVLNIPNSPYPWFIAHEIKDAIEYNKSAWHMINNNIPMEYSDFIAKLSVNDPIYQNSIEKFDSPQQGLSKIIANSDNRGGARTEVIIIALPALFELLSRSRMPRAMEFRFWLNTEILPGLYNHPDITKQLHEEHQLRLQAEQALEQAEHDRDIYHNLYRDYYNDRNRMVQERNMYRNNPMLMIQYYNYLLETDPTLNPKVFDEKGFEYIGVINPNFDKVKYDKVMSGIKKCEELLKAYLR